MKKETINTFSKGMMLDLHPMTTPNDSLSNALNATLITHNGNEFILQNDMGNGRVETAFLPAGYVPVGVKEHGGIIYVASHNPITGRNQLGSFPSPEKNIMSEEIMKRGDKLVELQNTDFGKGLNKTAYIKKVLLNDGAKIRPGDKFLVGVKDLSSNSLQYVVGSNSKEGDYPKFIRLHLAVINDDNTISYIDEEKGYWKPIEITDNDGSGDFTLESYREFIDNNYKVYTNKVSGTLAIVAELEAIDNYEVDWDYDISLDENDNYKIKISAVNKWITKNLNPYSITHDLQLSGDKAIINYPNENKEITPNDSIDEGDLFNRKLRFPDSDSDDESINTIVTTINRSDFLKDPLFHYKSTPSMFYGKLNYLSKSGVVDLSKLNSGIIDLHSYRYFVDDNEGYITISWGINAYLKKNQRITGIRIEYIDFEDAKDTRDLGWDNNNRVKSVNLKQRVNYLGTFEDTFKLNGVDFKNNNFYLTRFIVSVNDKDYLIKNRFLYTTKIFNKYYITHEYNDFSDIPIKGYIDVDYDIKSSEKTLLSNKIHIGNTAELSQSDNTSPSIKDSESWIRDDVEVEYSISKLASVKDEDGYNHFYGINKLNEIQFKEDIVKDDIYYSLDNDNNFDIKGGGNSEELFQYINNQKNKDVEYQSLEEEEISNSPDILNDTYSIEFTNNKIILKAKSVNRAYFNYKKNSMSSNNILEPLIDITNEGETISALGEILGHNNFNYSIGGLVALRKTLGYRLNKGNRMWSHFNDVSLSKDTTKVHEATGHSRKFRMDSPPKLAFGEGSCADHLPKFMKDQSELFKSNEPTIVPLCIAPRDHKDDRTGGFKSRNKGYSLKSNLKRTYERSTQTPIALCFRLEDAKNISDFKMINVITKSNWDDTKPSFIEYDNNVLNLILCLYGQILTLTRNKNESYKIWTPNSIIHHKRNLNKTYNFKYNIKITSKPKHIFGDFNKDFFELNLTKFINNQSLKNIPDENSFEIKNSSFSKDIGYNISNSNINLLINDITFNENKSHVLCKIPYIKDNKLNLIYKLIESADLKTWYYYDGNTVKPIDRKNPSKWMRDDDYSKLIKGKYVKNDIAMYLTEINKKLYLKRSAINPIGKFERYDYINGSDFNYTSHNRGALCDIHRPYISYDTAIYTNHNMEP